MSDEQHICRHNEYILLSFQMDLSASQLTIQCFEWPDNGFWTICINGRRYESPLKNEHVLTFN